MSGIGHNGGDQFSRYELNIIAISSWVGDKRVKEALSRQDLAGLTGLDRLVALRNASLDNLHQFYLKNPQADVAPGVLATVCMLSDNGDGCCTISSVRLGKLLCRSDRAVRSAINRLELDGCVKVERRPGGTARVWPVINPIYAEQRDPISVVLDAHAPTDRHVAPSEPRKAASGVEEPRKAVSGVINFPTKSEVQNDTPEGHIRSDSLPHPGRPWQEPRKAASDDTAIDTAKEKKVSKFIGPASQTKPTIDPDQIDLEEVIAQVVDGEVIEPGTAKPKPPRKKPKTAFDPATFGPDDLAYALRAGMTDQQARAEFVQFRDHHLSKDNRFADWHAAWRTWVGNALKFASRGSTGRVQRRSDADIINDL